MAETVTVTWGEEVYSPISYNTLKVGPLSYTTTVKDNETPYEAGVRAMAVVQELFAEQFQIKIDEFNTRIKQLKEANPSESKDVFSAGSSFK